MNSPIDKIPGQIRVKETLNNILSSGKIPHALLFTGLDGIGKENAAIKFAQALISIKENTYTEKITHSIEQFAEPHIKLIFPLPRGKNETDSSSPTEKLTQDELDIVRDQIEKKILNPFHKITIPKANSIKINSIRDIKKFLALDYKEVGYRFILVFDAHLMNEEAQNALLKSLEDELNKLRPTIVSRCWKVNFGPLSEEQIIFILKNYFNVDEYSATEVSPFSLGSYQIALNLIEIGIHDLKDKTISLLRYSFGRKFNSAYEELNSILTDQNYSALPILINMIIAWLNDIQKFRLNFKHYYYTNHIDTLEKFNSKFPDVKLDELTSRLDKLSNDLVYNINPSLLSSNLIFELSSVVLQKN
jgi:DNA polymerase-3 subunit delta'